MAKQEQPAIIRAALHFRGQLVKGNLKASRQIIDAYLAAYKNIKPELDFVNKEIAAQIAAGAKPSSQLIFEKGRMERILSTVTTEIQKVTATSAKIVTAQQSDAVAQALKDAKVLSELARDPSLSWPPPAGITGPTWANINQGQLTSLVGIAGDGSPLHTLLGELAPDAADKAKAMLVSNVTQGRTATEIAHGMHEVLGANMARALAVARTETMRSYRVATQESFKENDDVIAKWRWVAQLSYSTCIACISMHGQEFPLTEPMASHVNCRCVAIPISKSFKELGAKGAKETNTSIQTGKDWFDKQPEDTQRKVLGPAKYDAWKDGKIGIDDMVKHSHSDDWGGSYHEASLKGALESAGAKE